jgi:hypothetical protein
LLQHSTADAMGIAVSDATMREWDRRAELFYPTRDLTPETADPNAPMVRELPQGRHRLLDADGQWLAPDAGNVRRRAPAHAAPDDSDEVEADETLSDVAPTDVDPTDVDPADDDVAAEDSSGVVDPAPVEAPEAASDENGSASADQ